MSKLQNPLEKILERTKYEDHLHRAQDRFAWKPFAIRFASLRKIASLSKYLLPLLSIATATTFLWTLLATSLPIWLAIPLALLMLTGWETAKAQLVRISSEMYYGGRQAGIALLVVTLFFSVGSVVMSMEGAKQLYNLSNSSFQELQKSHLKSVDSLQSYYTSEIQSLKEEKKQFYQNNTVYLGKGKYALNHKVAKAYADYDNRISYLQKLMHTKQGQLQDQFKEQKYLLSQGHQFNSLIFAAVACLVDLLILLTGWFIIYFDFQVLHEQQLIYKYQAVSPNDQLKQYATLPSTVSDWQLETTTSANTSSVSHKEESNASIGFKFNGKDEPQKEDKAASPKIKVSPRTDLDGLIGAVRSGIRDYRYLMKIFHANVKTVTEVINTYGQ
ncbi:hypothetical protein V6R21_03275 [Limibacter armeniacum]|uniref:hypothetical protein n=1 Tax=Limibacter armeniacum TaxID=466084 RepID=UPI002FE55705